jgi:hypothetical protein
MPGQETSQTATGNTPGQIITGDSVIPYGQDYTISIAPCDFELLWRGNSPVKPLKGLAIQGYQASLTRLQDVRSRDQLTEYDSS